MSQPVPCHYTKYNTEDNKERINSSPFIYFPIYLYLCVKITSLCKTLRDPYNKFFIKLTVCIFHLHRTHFFVYYSGIIIVIYYDPSYMSFEYVTKT